MGEPKLKPLSNRLLVKRSKKPASKGGILLPESAGEKPREGVVVTTGPGKYDEQGNREKMQVQVGDRVLFGPYSGSEVQTDLLNEEYLILSEDDVLGIVHTH